MSEWNDTSTSTPNLLSIRMWQQSTKKDCGGTDENDSNDDAMLGENERCNKDVRSHQTTQDMIEHAKNIRTVYATEEQLKYRAIVFSRCCGRPWLPASSSLSFKTHTSPSLPSRLLSRPTVQLVSFRTDYTVADLDDKPCTERSNRDKDRIR